MPVRSDTFNYLFLFAPGTGSTAVGAALREHCEGAWLPDDDRANSFKHATLDELLEAGLLSPRAIAGYYKIVGIRNPFDWYVADYVRWREKWPQVYETGYRRNPDRDEARRTYGWLHARASRRRMRLARKIPFADWVARELDPSNPRDFQGKFHRDVQFFLRQEFMDEDFERLKRELGLPGAARVSVVNRTEQRDTGVHYRDYYTPDLVDLVYQTYRPFFERFGYEF
jgi:hypothetical protein